MVRRSGLGRGLGALIPTEVLRDRGSSAELAVTAIRPNQRQPRSHFDEETLTSLTASIREIGGQIVLNEGCRNQPAPPRPEYSAGQRDERGRPHQQRKKERDFRRGARLLR